MLHFTDTAKGAVLVFLTSKFVAVLIGGLSMLARAICTTMEVGGIKTCIAIMSGLYISIFNYTAHSLLAHIDLYISLKSMRINDPVITKKRAVIMSALTWALSIIISGLGFVFEDPDWPGDGMTDCRRRSMVQLLGYGVALISSRGALYIALGVISVATWKLLSDSIRNNQLHNDGDKRNKIARYLEDRKRVMKILTIKACLTIVCWGCTCVRDLLGQICESCGFPDWFVQISNVLYVIPILAAGWIYLFYHKRFKEVCGWMFCRCRTSNNPNDEEMA